MAKNDTETGESNVHQQDSESSNTDLAELVRHIRQTDNMGISRTKFLVSFYEVNISRVLGKGSYGKVCLAKKSSSGKSFACKIMDVEEAPVNFVKRFLPRELEILSQLNHSNVIHVYTYVKHHSVYYIFMDHCANGDLLRYLQRKGQSGEKLTEDESREKFTQILMGVKYLHQRHIAHRDLKCENILIDGTTLKLADFGFARFCVEPEARRRSSTHVDRIDVQNFRSRNIAVLQTSDPDDEELVNHEIRRRSRGRHSASAALAHLNSLVAQPDDNQAHNMPSSSSSAARKRRRHSSQTTMKSNSFCGSVAYASPEVVAGEEYDPKISDMWSCGVILYILMMGKMPFDDSHPRKMLRRQRAKRYLEKIRNVLPEPGMNLIETLMEPSVIQRSTVEEALLHGWLRPIYKKKLQQLVAVEKHSKSSTKILLEISDVSVPNQEIIVLDNANSSEKLFLNHSVFSAQSSQSTRSGQSDQSGNSAISVFSTESKDSRPQDIRISQRKN